MARGSDTRSRILDIAQEAVLWKGFDATSIDEIVAAANLTKGGFFYHFPDKNALALALIEKHMEEEEDILGGIFARAQDLSDDPLQIALIVLKLVAEALDNMEREYPGCIVATAAYQDRLFDAQVRAATRQAMLLWRVRFRALLAAVVERYPPRIELDLDDLADSVNTVVEGGIVMARALGEPRVLAAQVLMLRNLLRAMFSPAT